MTGRATVPGDARARGSARPYQDPRYGAAPGGRGPGGRGPGGRGPRGGGGGGSYRGGGRGRIRPRWGRIIGVTAALIGVLALVFTLGAWAYVSSLDDKMKRTNAFSGLADQRAPKKVDGAMNILVLGSDSRKPGETPKAGKWRTDTIILLHVPANHEKAYLISLPRDLWVQVPESPDGQHGGAMAKLNAAYAWGGPPLMVQTVEHYTGVHLDHVAIVDFAGFKKVVDAVDGVRLCPEMPPGQDSFKSIHRYNGKPPRVFKKGCRNYGGEAALDYIRQRKQFPTGDFARMKHQQEFLKALMDKATSKDVFTSPTKLNAFMRTVTKAVTVDKDFSLMNMALQFRSLRSEDLKFMTTPNRGTDMINGQSVVVSDKEKASALFEAVANDEVGKWLKENPQKK